MLSTLSCPRKPKMPRYVATIEVEYTEDNRKVAEAIATRNFCAAIEAEFDDEADESESAIVTSVRKIRD